MKQNHHVVTLTANPALDMSTSVGHVVPEHKLRCATPTYEPGGGGINVARAIDHLGGQALACYLAGGPTGDHFESLLKEADIPQRRIHIQGSLRQSVSIFEEQSTQQYRFNMPGASVTPTEIDQMLATLRQMAPFPDLLVVSGSVPPGITSDVFADLAALSKERKARLIVDSSGKGLAWALNAGVYLIKPNYRELAEFVGRAIHGDQELILACRGLIRDGSAEAVVVSLGAGGAVLVTADEAHQYRAPTVPIQSKVGAGDSMVGGIVLGLAREMPIAEAVRFGVAAGAAAVMTPGSELCRRDDAERLFTQMSAQVSAEQSG